MKIFDSFKNKTWKGKGYSRNGNSLKISKNGILSHSIPLKKDKYAIKIFGRKKTGNGKLNILVKAKSGEVLLNEEITFESSNLSEKVIYFNGKPGVGVITLNRKSGSFGSVEIERIVVDSSAKSPLPVGRNIKNRKTRKMQKVSRYILPKYKINYKKIGVIIPYSLYGGAEEYLATYLNALDQENIYLISKTGNNIASKFKKEKVLQFRTHNDLKSILKSGGFDAVIYYNSLAIYNLLNNLDLPINLIEIYHSDFLWPDSLAQLKKRNNVSKIARVSPMLLNNLDTNAEIIDLPVSIDMKKFKRKISFLKKELGYQNSDTIIGTVSRLSKEKNIDYILNLSKVMKEYQFMVIGDGPEKSRLLNRIKNENIENVRLLGHKFNVENYYSIMNGFLLPSKMEGTPISILEAMATENPVFTTNVGAIDTLIKGGKNGFYINDDLQKTAEIISSNLKNALVINSAYNFVNENHNLDKNIFTFAKMLVPIQNKFQKVDINKVNILQGRFI